MTTPLGHFERTSTYVVDTLETPPDLFIDAEATDWKHLSWRDVGHPHQVDRYADGRHHELRIP